MGDFQVAVRGKASHHALLMWLQPWGWVVVYGMTIWKQTLDPRAFVLISLHAISFLPIRCFGPSPLPRPLVFRCMCCIPLFFLLLPPVQCQPLGIGAISHGLSLSYFQFQTDTMPNFLLVLKGFSFLD